MHIINRMNRIKYILILLIVVCGTVMTHTKESFGYEAYENDDTGYVVLMDDEATLLSGFEEDDLIEEMSKITEYGNVAFYTYDEAYGNTTSNIAREYYKENFGNSSGVVFVIDMDNRQIYFFTDGKVGNYLTKSYCDIIADNIYKKATAQNYYGCASKGYSQIYTLLQGRSVARPMQHISNIFIAICLGMIISFLIAYIGSKGKKVSNRQEIAAMFHSCYVNNPQAVFIRQSKRYSPQSSSGGGGGGGHGGGGGGGHGGGHSF